MPHNKIFLYIFIFGNDMRQTRQKFTPYLKENE